jgi:hypothetical protein
MSAQCPSLLSLLAEVPDPRGRQGKRHPLSATLALAVAATLCGYRSYGAIAEWGRNNGPALTAAWASRAPRPRVPPRSFSSFATWTGSAWRGRWAAGRKRCRPPCRLRAEAFRLGRRGPGQLTPQAGEWEPLAIDGKTVRGAQKQGALNVHLLSVLSHRLGLTLAQHAVPDPTNKITAIQTVLEGLILEGRGGDGRCPMATWCVAPPIACRSPFARGAGEGRLGVVPAPGFNRWELPERLGREEKLMAGEPAGSLLFTDRNGPRSPYLLRADR